MKWTIRYHKRAIQGVYRIERGAAAIVTDTIKKLADDPRPPQSESVAERTNIYTIEAAGRTISYELIEEEKILLVLWIG